MSVEFYGRFKTERSKKDKEKNLEKKERENEAEKQDERSERIISLERKKNKIEEESRVIDEKDDIEREDSYFDLYFQGRISRRDFLKMISGMVVGSGPVISLEIGKLAAILLEPRPTQTLRLTPKPTPTKGIRDPLEIKRVNKKIITEFKYLRKEETEFSQNIFSLKEEEIERLTLEVVNYLEDRLNKDSKFKKQFLEDLGIVYLIEKMSGRRPDIDSLIISIDNLSFNSFLLFFAFDVFIKWEDRVFPYNDESKAVDEIIIKRTSPNHIKNIDERSRDRLFKIFVDMFPVYFEQVNNSFSFPPLLRDHPNYYATVYQQLRIRHKSKAVTRLINMVFIPWKRSYSFGENYIRIFSS